MAISLPIDIVEFMWLASCVRSVHSGENADDGSGTKGLTAMVDRIQFFPVVFPLCIFVPIEVDLAIGANSFSFFFLGIFVKLRYPSNRSQIVFKYGMSAYDLLVTVLYCIKKSISSVHTHKAHKVLVHVQIHILCTPLFKEVCGN